MAEVAWAITTLSEQDRAVLDFEKDWWSRSGSKEAEIREHFGFSATRYYQMLNALLDKDSALAYDPLLIKRLRRMRTARQAERTARRLGLKIPV